MNNASSGEMFLFAMGLAGLIISYVLLRLFARSACSARISNHPDRHEWLDIAQNYLRVESTHLGFHFVCAVFGWLAMQAPPPAAPSVRNLLTVVLPLLLFSVQGGLVAAGYLTWQHHKSSIGVTAMNDAAAEGDS